MSGNKFALVFQVCYYYYSWFQTAWLDTNIHIYIYIYIYIITHVYTHLALTKELFVLVLLLCYTGYIFL